MAGPHDLTPRRGVAAIEFALTLPVFLFVVLGVADLSYFISNVYDVQRAARDGARVGSITLEGANPTGDQIRAASEAQARTVLEASGKPCGTGCSVQAEWFDQSGFKFIRVSVSYPHDAFTPAMGIVPQYAQAQFVMLTHQQ